MRNPRVKKSVFTLAQRLRAVRGKAIAEPNDQEESTKLGNTALLPKPVFKISDRATRAIATQLQALAAEHGMTVESLIEHARFVRRPSDF